MVADDRRIRIITGHYGSGKTEFAVNYVKKLRESVDGRVAIADLDIVNVYFRSREKKEELEEKGIQVIVTTHSPFLLEHIRNSNIRIVSRMGNIAMITKPDDDMMAEDILGIAQSYAGTLFVEDRVAYDYLSIILEDKAPYILKKYTIDIAEGGEKSITCRLEFPSSDKIKYNFI